MRTIRKSQLQVHLTQVNHNGAFAEESWTVEVDEPGDDVALLWGFARKQDAAMAARFLLSLELDWTLPSKQMWRQCAEAGYPDRDALMKGACEHLAW